MTQTTRRWRSRTWKAVVIWTLLSLVVPAVLLWLYATATAVDPIGGGWIWFGAFLLFVGAAGIWLVGLTLIAVAHAIGRERQRRLQPDESQSEGRP